MSSNRFCIDAGLYQLAEVRFRLTIYLMLHSQTNDSHNMIGMSGISAFLDHVTVW